MAVRRSQVAVAALVLCAGAAARAQQAPAPPPAPEPAIEVTVQATKSEAQRLEDSAEAVTVIRTRDERRQTADTGEILARTQGVNVRREGGLGSGASISLNGLADDQLRIFVDEVPIDLAGYPFGLVNVPVNLIERVEIYRGVVPIRFGADALGGAINVVTSRNYETHLGSSYQLGSFGVHRMTVNGRYRDEETGSIGGGHVFLDMAQNDFEMSNRLLATADGGSIPIDADRFHDAYHAYGGQLELGVVERPWAKRLLVSGFASTYDKDVQHNLVMSVPYGEVTRGETTYGSTLRYEVDLSDDVELSLLANYSYRALDFRDMATSHYRWNGETSLRIGQDRAPGEPARGEIIAEAYDFTLHEDGLYTRAGLAWAFTPGQVARVSVTSQLIWRTGDDHVPFREDLLHLDDRLQQVVAGAEHELKVLDERLTNIAFGKLYVLHVTHEGRPQRTINQDVYEMERDMRHAGAGDALRYDFTEWLSGKISYEYAIRLPRIDELFGDGALVEAKGDLKPERSHNLNVGPRLELKRTALGSFVLDTNVFVRDTRDLIILIGGAEFSPYANIADVRSVGVENAAAWDAPGREVGLDGAVTYQDIRNTTDYGQLAEYEGMRVPSRPYFFASWGAHGRARKLLGERDSLEPFYHGRYVHGFHRSWELGAEEYRPTESAQLSHALGVTYSVSSDLGDVACTLEIDNLTDARLYDVFGVQRPGRSFAIKVVGEI